MNYNYIIYNNKKVSIFTKKGKQLLKNYIKTYLFGQKGGNYSQSQQHNWETHDVTGDLLPLGDTVSGVDSAWSISFGII